MLVASSSCSLAVIIFSITILLILVISWIISLLSMLLAIPVSTTTIIIQGSSRSLSFLWLIFGLFILVILAACSGILWIRWLCPAAWRWFVILIISCSIIAHIVSRLTKALVPIFIRAIVHSTSASSRSGWGLLVLMSWSLSWGWFVIIWLGVISWIRIGRRTIHHWVGVLSSIIYRGLHIVWVEGLSVIWVCVISRVFALEIIVIIIVILLPIPVWLPSISSCFIIAVGSDRATEILLIITEVHGSHWTSTTNYGTLCTWSLSNRRRSLISVASKFASPIPPCAIVHLAVAVTTKLKSISTAVKVLIKVRIAASGPSSSVSTHLHAASLWAVVSAAHRHSVLTFASAGTVAVSRAHVHASVTMATCSTLIVINNLISIRSSDCR